VGEAEVKSAGRVREEDGTGRDREDPEDAAAVVMAARYRSVGSLCLSLSLSLSRSLSLSLDDHKYYVVNHAKLKRHSATVFS
jgi:hypothetical protein